MSPAVERPSKMVEEYCGVKFRTVFNNKKLLSNPKISELINWCNEFHKMGFTPDAGEGSAGNLSFRSDNGLIISCSQANFSKVTVKDFVEVINVDLNKKEILVNGIKEPSSESFMHNEIYSRRKDVNAVFHGHSEEFLKFGDRLKLPITKKEEAGGTIELMKEVVKVLDDNNLILIKNHGFISLGDSMGSAGNLAVKRYGQLQRVKKIT